MNVLLVLHQCRPLGASQYDHSVLLMNAQSTQTFMDQQFSLE